MKSRTSLDLSCDTNDLLTDDVKLTQVKSVEQMLQIKSSEQKYDTLTKEELQPLAEMS